MNMNTNNDKENHYSSGKKNENKSIDESNIQSKSLILRSIYKDDSIIDMKNNVEFLSDDENEISQVNNKKFLIFIPGKLLSKK